MKHLSTLLVLLFVCTCVRAQTALSVTQQNTDLAINLAFVVPGAEYDVVNYKVVYTTIDARGQPDTASGLLAIPLNRDLQFPLAAYMHGTVSNREAVPSREGVLERRLIAAFATNGYIVAAPDYIGLGDSEGFHPYVHADSEASSGRDLLLAAKGWMDEQGIAYNDQLFITGYSQGGHAAQALHRDIQENPSSDSLSVTAGAHLSGPYSISDVMRRASLSETRATLPGYIVYTYISYDTVYNLYDSLEQVFVPAYTDLIDSFERQVINLGDFNVRLDTLLQRRGEVVADIFQDSIRQQLETNDTSSQVIQALRRNDTYRWAPDAPTLLFYCTMDEQVPFENALLADSVMTRLGSTTVQTMTGGALTHGECVVPAVQATLGFFDQFAVTQPTTATRGVPITVSDLSVSPNPVSAGGELLVTGLTPGMNYRFAVTDLNGRLVQQGQLSGQQSRVRLSDGLSRGLHLLRIVHSNGDFTVSKLVVQ
ncbi:hypothetical protein LEM8419_01150 [Neolewinella maritima]|uniref:Serine aminopeptidase S33 domain-containing protein n=1 Tax=Neolewinella maritima TaxID=1383882 RepID=A0ABM9AYZ3_9BACT|nr:T9SS type A sorting domain-containing protein [Neolewinella maritima]CAH0999887.1 hypothetical protein LEM8419_01150 [Neolewinella maritima]